MYIGDFDPGDVVDGQFTTVNTSGVPTALATGVLAVYKDNDTSESVSGLTLTADFDGRTGLNHFRITTASDGTFYAAGSDFSVFVSAGTVAGTTIAGYAICKFSIQNRSHLRPTVAGRTLDVAVGGEAGIDWGNLANPGSTQGLTGTSVNVGTASPGTITATVIATGAIDADALSADAGNEIADAILDRDMAAGTDSGSSVVRTVRQALRFLRNKWDINSGILTVRKEDDSTTSWTGTTTASAGADAISGMDPAGP